MPADVKDKLICERRREKTIKGKEV